MVASLESAIDRFEDELPPLTSFILPGGSPAAATLHLARTTCRRAERLAVRLSEHESITDSIIAYLNRLSDLLFVLARVVNQQLGIPEHQWRSS
jgi:cob(I)alamin adenosyltransferase